MKRLHTLLHFMLIMCYSATFKNEKNVEIGSLGSALHFAGVWMQFASYARSHAEVNIAPSYCHVVLGSHILTKKYLYLLLRVFWL